MRSTLASRFLPMLLVAAAALPAAAYDFPGQGSAAAWSDALPYYNLANKYMNQQRFAEAAQKYREAIDRYQYDADFYINLGVACRKLEDYVGAEQAYKSAIAINGKDWSAWSNLGNAYLKQNRLKDTLAAFQRALKCNPPAADKANLNTDITDIHKVLRNLGQEPMPGAAGKKAQTKPARLAVQKPAGSSKAPAAPLKDWGYQ